jgi:V/A-type H+-transporting ATPase subunit I
MLEGKVLVLENETEANTETQHTLNLPTKISNSKFIKPFEEITKLYGLPVYSEIDPTPFIAITFPILFGLMFGDLGHGLVLLIGGATVGKLLKGNQGIRNIGWIMSACGAAACVAGVLFGEFFGKSFTPLWFSPFENVFNFLMFALFVGIVQISSGVVIEMTNYLLKHNMGDALLTALPKLLFFAGGVYLIATCQLDFGAWFSGPILAPVIPFIIIVAGKPIYTKIAKPTATHESENPEQETVVGRFFEGADFLTRILSNTMSYSRILALLMAHWALLLVVYNISGLIEPLGTLGLILAGIVIVIGNIGVLALEGLIVFIHTLRLHFYEWFSKFYKGTGVEFSPFKQKFVYTDLELKAKKD